MVSLIYKYTSTLLLLLLCSFQASAFGDSAVAEKKYPGLAICSALFSNFAVFSYNRFVAKEEYAKISISSIKKNLNSSWVWDTDEFLVNHIGHPYHGSFYYIAGRANGINFPGSSLLTVCNSAFWELFLETERPSYNDFISTTLGGITFGEMLHRCSFDISIFNRPVSFLVSPMDGFFMLFPFKQKVSRPFKLSSLFTSFGTGFVMTDFKNSDDFTSRNMVRAATVNLMADIVYGDIFGVSTLNPFSQFEASLKLSLSPKYYSINLISDGILIGKSIFATAPRFSTLGVSLHYDLLYNNLVAFSSNALGLSYKHIHTFQSTASIVAKSHINCVILGANNYTNLRTEDAIKTEAGHKRRDYDLGTGGNLKLSLTLSLPRFGKCEVAYSGYSIHTIPASNPQFGYKGFRLINIGLFKYEYPITTNLSVGLRADVYHKRSFDTNAADASEMINTVFFFVKRQFTEK